MNYSYFLILLCLVPFLFADSFAEETYRGDTYTDTLQPDGITHTWNSESQRYVETGNLDSQGRKIYAHYILDDQPTYVKVTNGDASFVFDKTTCSAQIYQGGIIAGNSIVSSDSYVPKFSTDGSGIWSIVNSVNDASCVTEIIETANSIEVSGTKTSSAGIFKIRYLKVDGQPLETILEATNLSSLTDRRFGVTQTQSIPQVITFGGQQRDLANHVGETFDRTWLENNKAELFEFSQGLKFNVIKAWDNLESVKINSVSDGMASISFNYLRNTPILAPNETLIIDPTYSSNNPTQDEKVITGNQAGTSCAAAASEVDASDLAMFLTDADFSGTCQRAFVEWNISSIPTGVDVTDTLFKFDIAIVTNSANCDITQNHLKLSTMAFQAIWDDIGNGTEYVNNNSYCTTTGNDKSVDLGSSADTEVEARLTNGDWFGIGLKFDSETRVSLGNRDVEIEDEESAGTPDPTLEITYVEPFLDIDFTAFDVDIIGDAAKITGSINITSGVSIPVHNTEIILLVNGSSIYTNSTIPSETTPYAVDFGPAWLQMTTDNVYNFTAQVSADNSFDDSFSSYPFDDDVFDAVGINNGTVTGTETYVAGEINNAFSFDGASYITLANESNFDFERTSPFSISFWLKWSAPDSGRVFTKNAANSATGIQINHSNNGDLIFRLINTATTNEIFVFSFSGSFADNIYHHYVFTYDGSSLASGVKLYADGVLEPLTISTDNLSATILNNNSAVIGANGDASNITTGEMDEVKFYDYELSSDQAIDLFLINGAYSATNSNSTSVFSARQYDPDYFTAIDPTQGLVNYTFSETNFLNVNRDTNSTLFNVECRYFTQTQAFQNPLTEGTWDNQTNVLFYTNDASGYYYVQCFNDGELFITAISQNFTNALVPGLIIFDQLGGFFGAPSVVLVIISILSLGTGRNYPIIMLIAASVTGILLALELLVLDPGLVVAIIIMTGIGLFGIRKFY